MLLILASALISACTSTGPSTHMLVTTEVYRSDAFAKRPETLEDNRDLWDRFDRNKSKALTFK